MKLKTLIVLLFILKSYSMTEVKHTSNLKNLSMSKEMNKSMNKLKVYDTYRLRSK